MSDNEPPPEEPTPPPAQEPTKVITRETPEGVLHAEIHDRPVEL